MMNEKLPEWVKTAMAKPITKRPGKIVRHIISEKVGRTYNDKGIINEKVPVYFATLFHKDGSPEEYSDKAVLCSAGNLKIIGFID